MCAAMWSEGDCLPCSCSSGNISLDGVPSSMSSLVVILFVRIGDVLCMSRARCSHIWLSDFQAKERH